MRKTWKTSTFRIYDSASKGKTLQYFTLLIQNGVKMTKLDKDDVDKESMVWKAVIILYVVGESPTI